MATAHSRSQQTVQSFGDVSRFLREGGADEESRQLRDSVGALAQHVEEAVRARRARRDATTITRCAASLVQGVREHQLFLTGLGSAWHALYEFGAYQGALGELRSAALAWHKALEHRNLREGAGFDRVELLAWRTLGEGLLLIDMYEQGADPLGGVPEAARRSPSAWSRVRSWWRRPRR